MGENIVLFDGHCKLCNRSIDLLMRLDQDRKLRFAPLSGKSAKLLNLQISSQPSEQTIIFYKSAGRVYERSEAVIEIAAEVLSLGRVLRVFKLIPQPLRDLAYRWIAKNRYKIFGRQETCRRPSPEERAQFLD